MKSNNKIFEIYREIIDIDKKLNRYEKLEQEYVLDYLINKNYETKREFVEDLYSITRDEEISDRFIKEILDNINISRSFIKLLRDVISNDLEYKKLVEVWLNDEKYGYKMAFSRFYIDYFNNAKNLEDIVKISPNISPWHLIAKADELGLKDVVFGKVPQEFGGSIEKFRNIIHTIKESDFFKSYVLAKNADADKDECKKIAKSLNLKTSDTMGILTEINKRLEEKTKEFYIDDLLIKPIVKSFSSKIVFVITAKDQKYILKLDPYAIDNLKISDRVRKFRENYYLRSDMPYTNALVNFYLKENNSINSSNIIFYDMLTDANLYEMTVDSGNHLKLDEDIYTNLALLKYSEEFEELYDLGINLNDITTGNFIINKNKNPILIDVGHVEFYHILRPMVCGYNFVLGNLCGRQVMKL